MSGRWDQLSERNYASDRKRRAEAKISLLPIARPHRATRGDKLWRLACRPRPCAIDAHEKYLTNPKVASMCATWIGCVFKIGQLSAISCVDLQPGVRFIHIPR